jgi:hypothetical protein
MSRKLESSPQTPLADDLIWGIRGRSGIAATLGIKPSQAKRTTWSHPARSPRARSVIARSLPRALCCGDTSPATFPATILKKPPEITRKAPEANPGPFAFRSTTGRQWNDPCSIAALPPLRKFGAGAATAAAPPGSKHRPRIRATRSAAGPASRTSICPAALSVSGSSTGRPPAGRCAIAKNAGANSGAIGIFRHPVPRVGFVAERLRKYPFYGPQNRY